MLDTGKFISDEMLLLLTSLRHVCDFALLSFLLPRLEPFLDANDGFLSREKANQSFDGSPPTRLIAQGGTMML